MRDHFPMYRQTQIETLLGLSIGFIGALMALLMMTLGSHNPACQVLALCGSGVGAVSIMLAALNFRSTVGMYHKVYAPLLCAALSFVTSNCMFDVYSTGHPNGVTGQVGLWFLVASFVIQVPILGMWVKYFITEPAPWRPVYFL